MNLWLSIFLLLSAPLFASLSPLKFDKAIERVVERNPDVGIQQANRDRVHAANTADRLTLLPSLSIQADQQFRRTYLDSETFKSRSVEGIVNFNVFKFGADFSKMRAASAEVAAEEEKTLNAKIQAENRAVNALSEFIQNSKEVEIYKKIVDTRKMLVKVSDERFKKGLMARQDVNALTVDLDNAVANYRDSQTRLIEARAKLVELLGHDRLIIAWPWMQSLPNWQKNTSAEQLKERPAWKAAERRVEAADYRQKQSWGEMLPSLDIRVGYGFTDDTTRDKNGTNFSGMLTLSIPLFDRLSNFGRYKAQVYQRAAAELAFEQEKRRALKEWQIAKGTFEIALESALAREKTLATSRKLYEDNLKRFRRGLVKVNDLSIDQQRMFNAELLSIRGWKDAHVNYADLCHSLGKRVRQCIASL